MGKEAERFFGESERFRERREENFKSSYGVCGFVGGILGREGDYDGALS